MARKKKLPPLAFMSYVHSDDKYGHPSEFRQRLSDEVRAQLGEEFPIFQDRNDIAWGQNWEERIDKSLGEEVTFFIPIITPSFFKSPPCRKELECFLAREEALGRKDLILPVYFIDCPLLNDEKKRKADKLAQVIADRQYADWREYRLESFTNPAVAKTLAKFATQVRDALNRSTPLSSASVTNVSIRRNKTRLTPDTELPIASPQADKIAPQETETRGPSSKTEPLVLVVDPMHRGDHTTISAAIAAAKPGTRILVRPGLYQEGLVIDKPLEIVGDGDVVDIVVQATGTNAILFKTTMGRVANLTLRQAGGGKWFGVNITQGRLDLEECDISSASLACIAIHDGADPRIRRNNIHNGNRSGINIFKSGLGTLEENDIFENSSTGVEIKEGSNPTLRHNRIHDCKSCGVFIRKKGQGILEGNEIYANNHCGVVVEEEGDPLLIQNIIYLNKYQAICVRNAGIGTFEENDLRENKQGAWYITNDCLKNVKCSNNLE